jgi:hypothetical protein
MAGRRQQGSRDSRGAANAASADPQTRERDEQQNLGVSGLVEALRPYLDLLGVIAAVSLPFAAIRILAAASWDQSIALALITNTAVSDLAAAFIVLALPAWLSVAAIWLAMEAASGEPRSRWSKFLFMLCITGYILLVADSWLGLAVGAGFPLVMFATAYLADRNKPRQQAYEENKRIMLSLILLSLLNSVTSSALWLPPERIVVDAVPSRVHVLKESESEIIAYVATKKVVLRIEKDKVTERQYCAPGSANPIFRNRKDDRPKCPKG